MKTSINLYLEEFKPKPDPLSLNIVASAWIGSLVVMSLLYWFTVSDLQHKSQLEAGLSIELKEQKAESELLKERALSHGFDPILVKEAEILERDIKNKRLLITAISSSSAMNAQGYSGLMYDLANYVGQDIWITMVQYTPNDIVIRGGTRAPEALPKWLDDISQSTYFSGKPLNKLTMSANGDKTYTLFEVATNKESSLLNASERGLP